MAVVVAAGFTTGSEVGHAATPAYSGAKKVAVILMDFPNNQNRQITPAQAKQRLFTDSDSTAAFYSQASNGALTLTGRDDVTGGDVYGWYTSDFAATCSTTPTQIGDEADRQVLLNGGSLQGYDYFVYVVTQPPCVQAAGNSGGSGTNRFWIYGHSPTFISRVASHEFGHNFGLMHSDAENCAVADVAATAQPNATCTTEPVGDLWDPMGSTSEGTRFFHGFNRAALGFTDPTFASAFGDYTLKPVEDTSLTTDQLLVVPKPGGNLNYYLDFRQPRLPFSSFNSIDSVANGVTIRQGPALSHPVTANPDLIKASPSTEYGYNSPRGQFLAPGRSFYDPTGDFTISTLSVSATGAVVRYSDGSPGAPSLVNISDGVLTVASAANQSSDIGIGKSDGRFRVIDNGGPLQAGAGCAQVTASQVSCASTGVFEADISLGDRDDAVSLKSIDLPATIDGGDGNDVLHAGGGKDVIRAGAGDDLLFGAGGGDKLDGGIGNDSFSGGGDQNNTLDYSSRNENLTIDVSTGNSNVVGGAVGEIDTYSPQLAEFTTVIGGSGDDSIIGSPSDDFIDGRAGTDTVLAGAGNDLTKLTDGGFADDVECGDGIDTVKLDSADSADPLTCESPDITPDTTIDSAPRSMTSSSNVSFSFSSSYPEATFECRVDGGDFSSCSSPRSFTLADGAHEFSVRAAVNGSPDATPATKTFVVDTTAPNTSITTQAVLSAVASPVIEFTSTESPSLFECQIDFGSFENCGSPFQLPQLAAGNHTFYVRAIDSVGNVDQSAASIEFSTAPTGVSVQGDTLIYSAASGAIDSPMVSSSGDYIFVSVPSEQVLLPGPGCFTDSPNRVGCHAAGLSQIEVGLGDLNDGFSNMTDLPASVDAGSGNDSVTAGTGTESFRGGPGNDGVAYTYRTQPLQLSLDGIANDGAFSNGVSTEGDLIGTDFENVSGGASDDTIVGNADANQLSGHLGQDVLLGEAGNDILHGGDGDDTIDGASGFDTLFGSAGNDSLMGGSGADQLFGGEAYSTLNSGDDAIVPGTGYDFVTAADGNDDVRTRDNEADSINCGDGIDNLRAESLDGFAGGECESEAPAIETSITSGPPDGGNSSDASATYTFAAAEADHSFECSFDGSEFTQCESPHTVVAATETSHTFAVRAVDPDEPTYVDPSPATRTFTPSLNGVKVIDGVLKFIGTPGESGVVLLEQTGANFIVNSANPVPAGAGCVAVNANQASCPSALITSAELRLGDGDDIVYSSLPVPTDAYGEGGNDTINTGPENDHLYGGTGDDWLFGGGGANVLRGQGDRDWANYAYATEAVTVLLDGEANDGIGNGAQSDDVGTDIESVQLSGFDDSFLGSELSVSVIGNAGADTIIGSAYNDVLYGSEGNDEILTISGNDLVVGGAGDDMIYARDGDLDDVRCDDDTDTAIIDLGDATSDCESAPTQPETNIITGPTDGSFVNVASSTFGFSSPEPTSVFECRIDGGAFVSCSSPHVTGPLSAGTHEFQVRAIDPVQGVVDPTPATRSFTVDITAPQTTITSAAPTPSNDTTPSWSFDSSEPGSVFACKIELTAVPGSAQFAPCSGPGGSHTPPALADGAYTFTVYATDSAGNVDNSPATASVVIDSTAPTATIVSGPANGSVIDVSAVTFTFQSNEAGSSFQCSYDGAPFTGCTSPSNETLSGGLHSFTVRATDSLGNVGPATSLRTFTVVLPGTLSATAATFSSPVNLSSPVPLDWVHWGRSVPTDVNRKSGTSTIGPLTTLPTSTGVTVSRVTASAPTFSWTGGDPIASGSVAAGVAVGAAKDRGFRLTVPASPSAARTLKLYVGVTNTTGRLVASLSDGSSASVTNTSITSGTSSPVNRVFTINYRSYTSGATLTVDWTKDTTSTATSSTVRLYAANLSNVADVTSPETTITSGPANNATVTTTTASFGLSSSEPTGGRFQCKFDNQAFAWCTSPFVTPTLTTGSHTVQFRAVDAAGNYDLTPVTRSFSKN